MATTGWVGSLGSWVGGGGGLSRALPGRGVLSAPRPDSVLTQEESLPFLATAGTFSLAALKLQLSLHLHPSHSLPAEAPAPGLPSSNCPPSQAWAALDTPHPLRKAAVSSSH